MIVCNRCGSSDVFIKHWVSQLDPSNYTWDECGDVWCEECEDRTTGLTQENYNEEQNDLKIEASL